MLDPELFFEGNPELFDEMLVLGLNLSVIKRFTSFAK
jgi:hypothetical protein